MRRFLTLIVVLCLAVPAGISISGCSRNPAGSYCNGLGYGQKLTAVNAIILQPETIGISLAFGQTTQVHNPSATNCKGASVGAVGGYTFGTTNNQLVDISPGGILCAGTWNRNSAGGIPNFTICTPPTLSACTQPNQTLCTPTSPYGTALITASGGGVTSNPVTVYIHPLITALSLVGPPACLSQGQTSQLDGIAYYANNGIKQALCAPNSLTVPSCAAVVGNLYYSSSNPGVATINEHGVITAVQPGTTGITSTLANSGASAGYFSTCPPKSIEVTVNGATTATVSQGIQQNLTTTVTDTQGNQITGLTLNYQSTNPSTIMANATGTISANFPGQAAIYATCEPFSCNPAPINQIGVQGTGLPVSSNAVNVTVPGTASTLAWFGSPHQSQYFSSVELLTGAIDSSVRLPYVPNSMVMDTQSNNLYFGSSHGLMIYDTNNILQRQDPTVPGVVLAVSPDGSIVIINDQTRGLFYIYRPGNGIATDFSGFGVAAAFTPDSRTVYIVDNAAAGTGHSDALYVYNLSYSWNPYSLDNYIPSTIPGGAQNVAITVPGVGAYLAGPLTAATAWCPAGPVANYTQDVFYPQADAVLDPSSNPVPTDALAATTDGKHIIGAALSAPGATTAQLSDIGVNVLSTSDGIPGTPGYVGTNSAFPGVCPSVADGDIVASQLMPALTLTHTLNQTTLTFSTTAEQINQVVTSRPTIGSTAQNLAFITYTAPSSGATTGATLPYYQTSASGPGTLGTTGSVLLTGAASITAPIAGIFSPDNTLFFVSTSGDNLVHYIDVKTLTDTHTISPGLAACTVGSDPDCTTTVPAGNQVPATVITVKPRRTT